MATGREIRSLSGHFSGVNSVAFSGDGQILASADNGNTIKLWDVAAGTQIYTLTGDSWYENYVHVNSVAFSSDGQILASGHNDTIELSEVATGREIGSLSHFDQVNSVAFSPDGGWLAAGDSSGNIKIWRWAKPL
ncbi:MAG: hypothetical protein NWQ28_02110 [Nodularia sp. (in: cyanobacteria)]|nr:hypothetical protein [Nodularia sp. (in: cyanobacteria)]